jgi:hypothetical protein
MFFLLRCLFWLALVMYFAGHAPGHRLESLAGHPGQPTSPLLDPQTGSKWLAQACLAAPERCREAGAMLMPLAGTAAPAIEPVAKHAVAPKPRPTCSGAVCPKL